MTPPAFRLVRFPSLFPVPWLRETRRHESLLFPPWLEIARDPAGNGSPPRRCPQLSSLLARFQDEHDGISNYVSKWNNIIREDTGRVSEIRTKLHGRRMDQEEKEEDPLENPHGQLSPPDKIFSAGKRHIAGGGVDDHQPPFHSLPPGHSRTGNIFVCRENVLVPVIKRDRCHISRFTVLHETEIGISNKLLPRFPPLRFFFFSPPPRFSSSLVTWFKFSPIDRKMRRDSFLRIFLILSLSLFLFRKNRLCRVGEGGNKGGGTFSNYWTGLWRDYRRERNFPGIILIGQRDRA